MTLFVHRNAGGRCPCGAENAACGPPSDVVPADQLVEEVAAVSGPLKKYKVTRNGFETVMKLSDEDAKRLGAGPYKVADSASTVEPVTPVGDSGSQDDGAAPAGAAAAVAEAGTEPQPEPAGDGQTPDDPQAPPSTGDGDAQAAAAEPAKAPAKRRATAANKARTSAANKADGAS